MIETRPAVLRGRASDRQDELLGASIDTTSLCNLRCTTCSLDEWYQHKGVMTLATFTRIAESLAHLKHLALSVNAEPLLNSNLVRMLEIAKRATAGRIVASFTTNATLLEERIALALFERGLDALEISLDGATQATFEAIRIRAHWHTVIENVERLAQLKRRLNSATPHLSIRFTLFEDNRDDVVELLDLARRLEIDHVVINGLEPYDEQLAGKVLYAKSPRAETVELFEALEARAAELGMRLDLPLPAPDPIDDCRLIDHSCIVLWNGDVAPCSPLGYTREFFAFGERIRHEQLLFGNVNDKPLHEIWEEPRYVDWRAQLRDGHIFEECKTCLKRAGVICPLKHWKWLAEPRRA